MLFQSVHRETPTLSEVLLFRSSKGEEKFVGSTVCHCDYGTQSIVQSVTVIMNAVPDRLAVCIVSADVAGGLFLPKRR